MTKFRFDPEPDVANVSAILPASTVAVYASRAVPGAVSVTMTQDGVIQAGTRLTREQASALARSLVALLGTEDDDPHTLGFDLGYAAGHKEGEREGFNAGWDDGHGDGYSEGWDEGYTLGFERGVEGEIA